MTMNGYPGSTSSESAQQLIDLKRAIDHAAIIATTDVTGRITYVNDKFCEISRYSRDELIGQDHRIVNSGFHPKELIRGLWRTIAQGQVWRGELRNRAKDGSIYWVDTTIVPLLDTDGKPRQYIAIRSDITSRKAAEQQLADQAALAQLGQLAAVVAHEVRNPLAGVKGSLQVLQSRPSTAPDDRRVIEAMVARIDVLNSKVGDILRFARPRAPMIEDLDLRPIVLDAAVSAEAAAGRGNPGIHVADVAVAIRADGERRGEILLSLLLNACQSGSSAPIEILVSTERGTCRIDVADRGEGLGGADPEQLFAAFHTTKKSGTGLGLAIVRRLLSLQGGSVALLAREGGGAIARVTLPGVSTRS